jgi:hypothetical protein
MVLLQFDTTKIPRKISARLTLKILPGNWREYAEKAIGETFPRTLKAHATRILKSEETEHALRYLIPAAKGGVLDLEVLMGAIHTYATAMLPSSRPSRKQAKQIADALRRALTELDFIFTRRSRGPVTLAADIRRTIEGKRGGHLHREIPHYRPRLEVHDPFRSPNAMRSRTC